MTAKGSKSELPLVIFTLLAQTAVGAFLASAAARLWLAGELGPMLADQITRPGFWLAAALIAVGLLASLLHLGSPWRAFRALANLRTSWLSREILFSIAFSVTALAVPWLTMEAPAWTAGQVGAAALGVLSGLALVYSMGRLYMLSTTPAWHSGKTLAAFGLTTAISGLLAAGLALAGGNLNFVDGIVLYAGETTAQSLAVFSLLRALRFLLWVVLASGSLQILVQFSTARAGKSRPLALQAALLLVGMSILRVVFLSAAVTPAADLLDLAWLALAFCLVFTAEAIGRNRFYALHRIL